MNTPWETVVALCDPEQRRSLAKILAQFGLDAMCVQTVGQCRELLDRGGVGLLFCGQFFPDGDYRAILNASRPRPDNPSVILAAPRTTSLADEAISLGAFDLVGIPFRPTDVEWTVIKARRRQTAPARVCATPEVVQPLEQTEHLVRHAS